MSANLWRVTCGKCGAEIIHDACNCAAAQPTEPEGAAPEGGDDVEAGDELCEGCDGAGWVVDPDQLTPCPVCRAEDVEASGAGTACKFCGHPVVNNPISLAIRAHQPCVDLAVHDLASLRQDRDEARRERDRMKLLLSWNNTAHEHHPDGDFRSPTVQALTWEALSLSTESEASDER